MPWYEKEESTSFDLLQIPGIYFVNGDALSQIERFIATAERKQPRITFPSNLEFRLTTSHKVALFGQMELPLQASRDRAYREAWIIALLTGDKVVKKGENELQIWDTNEGKQYVVTYDNIEQRIANVEIVSSAKKSS